MLNATYPTLLIPRLLFAANLSRKLSAAAIAAAYRVTPPKSLFMVLEISITITTAISGSSTISLIFWDVCTCSVMSNTFSRSVPEIVLLTETAPSFEVLVPPLSTTCTLEGGVEVSSLPSSSTESDADLAENVLLLADLTEELLSSLYSSNQPLSSSSFQLSPTAGSAILSGSVFSEATSSLSSVSAEFSSPSVFPADLAVISPDAVSKHSSPWVWARTSSLPQVKAPDSS